MKKVFLVVLFLVNSFTIMNPGVLISVSFPYSPPVVNLPLPFPINDIVVSNLELTTVELRQVDYTWKLTATKADVNVTRAVVSFDWYYKKDSGKGFFIQDELQFIFDWNFNITKDSRFQISITNTKIHPGKMKVELAGGVIETVVVEVTNLILNRASIIFRGIIANKLSSAITDASTVLGKDIQLYHDKDRNKDIKLNTTLITAPFITNQTLFIQVNAAPFIQGESSGFLNPPDILTKANSTKIQVQIHKLMITKILELVMKIRGDIFVEFQTSSITSVIDIDSLALSPVFPPMAFFPQNRDIVFSVGIPTLTFDFSSQNFLLKFRGQCTVSTQQKFDKVRSLYMNPINVSASVELAPIFGPVISNIRIQKLQVLSFNADKQDVDSKFVIPEQLSRNFVELMDWITQAGNFELNRRVLRLNYQNIKVVIKGKVLDQRSYNLEIDLK